MIELDINKLVEDILDVYVILPHPDDEVPFSSGLVQRIKDKTNKKVHLICLTKGEGSTLNHTKSEKLHDKRMHELATSCETIGFDSFIISDFPDGDIGSYIEKIEKLIRKNISDKSLLVTYEPNGISGHKDHVHLTELITEKFNNKKILFTVPESFEMDEGTLSMKERIVDDTPTAPTHFLKLTSKERECKIHAFKAHESQFGWDDKEFYEFWEPRLVLDKEFFILDED